MKKIKLLALTLALVMITLAVASCGSSVKKTVNCTLSVVIDGEFVVDSLEVPVKTEETPVVQDALKVAFDYLGFDYELSSTSLKRVLIDGKEYAEGLDSTGENLYFWNYLANGEEPENGSAAVNELKDGDIIVFIYEKLPVENTTADTSADAEG